MEAAITSLASVAHPWVMAGQQKIRFGILLLDNQQDWRHTCQFARFSEALGYDALWVVDHPGMGISDCWTTLTVLATATTTIRLGSAVSCLSYRSPWYLARIAADVDRLSNGRLILGMGIGDNLEEFRQLGIAPLSVRARQRALEETIQILYRLWSASSLTFDGNYFQLQQATIAPKPVQSPHIPLLIAGGGERTTLRQVAQYADMSNFAAHSWAGSACDSEDVVRKYAALLMHCRALGRSYDAILRSYLCLCTLIAPTLSRVDIKKAADPLGVREFLLPSTVAGTPAELIHYYQTLIDCGVQYFIVGVYTHDRETVSLLANDVIPAVVSSSQIRKIEHARKKGEIDV